MTIATLLFALIAIPANAAGAGEPIMLDFTADLVRAVPADAPGHRATGREGLPDQVGRHRPVARPGRALPGHGRPDLHRHRPDDRPRARPDRRAPARLRTSASLYQRGPTGRSSEARDAERREQADDAVEAQRRRDPAATTTAPAAQASPNPKPWETVVRIKVHGQGSIGFGSGTIIYSTPEESIILTCAHIFKTGTGRISAPRGSPGRSRSTSSTATSAGRKQNQVHYTNETFDGEAIDYDFARDVGLIRIRPGRRLPYARVVPRALEADEPAWG